MGGLPFVRAGGCDCVCSYRALVVSSSSLRSSFARCPWYLRGPSAADLNRFWLVRLWYIFGGSLMSCGAVCVSVDERTIRADAYILEPTSTSIMPDGVQSSRSFRAVCTHSSVRCAKMAKLRALADAARVTGWSIFKKALCRSCSLHCGERKKNI